MEVGLRVVTDGTYLGRLLANHNVSAVAALPDYVAILGEYALLLDVIQELAIALLVLLLDFGHALKLLGYLVEAFLASLLGHAGIHVGPLEVLAISGCLKILGGALDSSAFQQLEPHLGVLLLVVSRLLKDCGYLYITVLLGL